jgi:DNA-binding NarL/FixJ family response regulator
MAGTTSRLPEKALYERATTAVRDGLGAEAFDSAWEAGRMLTPDQVFAEAGPLVTEGELVVSSDDAAVVADEQASRVGLTPREIEVLRLVARHLTDKEIATELGLSPRTVMHHVSSVLGKLGVATRREAAARTTNHELV